MTTTTKSSMKEEDAGHYLDLAQPPPRVQHCYHDDADTYKPGSVSAAAAAAVAADATITTTTRHLKNNATETQEGLHVQRPGAIRVRGMGRSGMGATSDGEDEATIVYDTTEIIQSGNNNPNNNEPDPPPEIHEDTQVDERKEDEEGTRLNYACIGMTFLLVIVCVLALVLGLSLSNRRNDNVPTQSQVQTASPAPTTTATPAPTTTASPTNSPTHSPTSYMADLAISVLSIYIPGIPVTPLQQQALDWLVENDDGLITGGTTGDNDDDSSNDDGRLLDRYILAILYLSTNGNEWRDNNGWLTEVTVCLWYQTICDENNRVGRIHLGFNDLQGTIPTEVGLLTELTYLSLTNNNNLEGTIPTEIGMLTALTSFRLYRNGLTGTIPTEIGALSSALTDLVLYVNVLSGTIPTEIGALNALTALVLGNNALNGPLPSELGSLTALTYLYMASNNLEGTLPTEIGRLTSLNTLYLSQTGITGEVPSELDDFLGDLEICFLGLNPDLDGVPSNCDYPF